MDFQPYITQSHEPSFPKVLWNRPLSRSSSGRLLLVGGHRNEFSLVQSIYQSALACGIGQCAVVLPDSLKPVLGNFEDAYFVPSSPSGSIGRGALADLTTAAIEHDAISTGANLSNNSETTVVIERLLSESERPACLYMDATDITNLNLKLLTERSDICLVANMPELFKLAGKLGVALSVKPERGVLGRVEIVQTIVTNLKASLVCVGQEIIIVSQSQTSVTPNIKSGLEAQIYAAMSVFWAQKQSFEHLTTAAFIIEKISQVLPNQNQVTISQTTLEIEKLLMSF